MPKVSIVIPVYNAAFFLKNTLECIHNQTFKDFECVIVNDGSTDNSLEIINSYTAIDTRFRCTTIKNSGSGFIPRSLGIKESKSDFIVYMDADDLFDYDSLEKLYLRQIETNADVVLLRTLGCEIESKKEMWRLPLDNFDFNQVLTGPESCNLTIGGWKIPCCGMLFKKYLFEYIPQEKGSLFIFDEILGRYILFYAKNVAFADTNYYYLNNASSITKLLSIRFFERLFIDEELEKFLNQVYGINSETSKVMRITRLKNMINLQSLYFLNKKRFSLDERKKVRDMLKKAYRTQNIHLLKKELTILKQILFFRTYWAFRISSILFVFLKKMQGSHYNFK